MPSPVDAMSESMVLERDCASLQSSGLTDPGIPKRDLGCLIGHWSDHVAF